MKLFRKTRELTRFSLLCGLCMIVLGCSGYSENDTRVQIQLTGKTLYFAGDFTPQTIRRFRDVTAKLDAGVLDRIIINSGGGSTEIGREIGRWVYRLGLDVEIEGKCFSSCANYVFPAGARKVIRDGAFVGWHGSETQYEILALSDPRRSAAELERQELQRALLQANNMSVSSPEFRAMLGEQLKRMEVSRQDEAAFFNEIGIDREFTLHGHRPKHFPGLKASGKPGWTYSIADMARLGLRRVLYAGSGNYADSPAVRRNVKVLNYISSIVPGKS